MKISIINSKTNLWSPSKYFKTKHNLFFTFHKNLEPQIKQSQLVLFFFD
jgi:hypothetical protein